MLDLTLRRNHGAGLISEEVKSPLQSCGLWCLFKTTSTCLPLFQITIICTQDSSPSPPTEEEMGLVSSLLWMRRQRRGGPPSKTTLSGEHGRHSRAKSPEQQERADSPGPSCVSMKSDHSMELHVTFKDGNPSIEKR
ncbi:hypothetical protein N1851_019389 [Merluccius polli]|uniref:Uncharacterized protein n=1 Tax=Merluccius polli TaxID=89951 RepID=A0AA47MLQ3_MERPO|nr:hypothetical protein N1851_019389 [Merluccius polli]